jgi:hypothetical protein
LKSPKSAVEHAERALRYANIDLERLLCSAEKEKWELARMEAKLKNLYTGEANMVSTSRRSGTDMC